ncbi:MAG TPA: tetratricopeptide repeat protein [Spirochaetota bacterium]|nr:tetratricopeptide repeat protein [Spirochaetota bacterium]
MMKQGIIVGAVLVVLGIGVFAYYDRFIRHEREAQELLTEGKLIYERGSRDAVNDSINIFSKVIARYPGTRAESEAYFNIAQAYEKMNLNRLAYLKYVYILKNARNIDEGFAREIKARIARLKVMKRYTEEGIYELMGLLHHSENRDFRSRVYTELGHTYLQMRELEKSKRMFDIALTENGENEEALLGKARAYKRLGEDDMAYNLYEYYLKYYGNFSPYADDVKSSYLRQVYQSGHQNYRSGRYPAAISYFKRVLNRFPESGFTENSLYWIGQCYFAMHKYGSAINYYDRVLNNYDSGKDEAARIRKGYSYFLMKKFDLAAREFQIYINNYPRGANIDTAKKWKSMSTQEMLYRIQNRMIPDAEEEEAKPEGEKKGGKSSGSDRERTPDDRAMTGSPAYDDEAEYENVGEL